MKSEQRAGREFPEMPLWVFERPVPGNGAGRNGKHLILHGRLQLWESGVAPALGDNALGEASF